MVLVCVALLGCSAGDPADKAAPTVASGWSNLGDHPFEERWWPMVAWAGDELVVFGGDRRGSGDFEQVFLNDGASFDPSANEWRQLPEAPFEAELVRPDGLWTGEVLIVGGQRCGPSAEWESASPEGCEAPGFDLAWYDPAAKEWGHRDLPAELAAADCGGLLVGWTGSEAIIHAMACAGEQRLWSLDPAAGDAMDLPDPPIATDRVCAGAGRTVVVETGGNSVRAAVRHDGGGWSAEIVHGLGIAETGPILCVGSDVLVAQSFQAGAPAALFDADTGTWRAAASSPVDLMADAATWTGSELILLVHGRPAPYAYNPTGDAWRELPPVDTSKVTDIVWAGDRVVLFSGHPMGMFFRAYDPSS